MKNIKFRIYFNFILALGLLAGNSCTDMLEVEPISTITAAGFWVNEDNANGALSGMYVRFRDQASSNLFVWGEGRSETLSYGLQASEGLERYFLNDVDPNFSGPNWLRMYTVVHDANLIIKYVPGITFNNVANKNRMLAEAYTMRAFLYFTMVRTWGGVPLVVDPTEGYDAEMTFRPRASVEEIFTQIKADLDRALELYPNNNVGTGRAYWSKPSANVLKAEVFLWTGKVLNGGQADFTTALSALNDAQGAGGLGLLPNYDNIFRYSNKGNSEVLFGVRYLDLEAGANYNANMYIRDDEIPPSASDEVKAKLGQGGGLNRWAPSQTIRAQFDERDSRRDASFVEIFVPNNEGGQNYYGSAVRKYRGYVDPSGRRFIDDIIIYRYADLLLLKAEAKNALGQDPSPEMNEIRQRAYGANFDDFRFVNGSREANDEAILQERLFEFAFEGKRWWDLVRFDKAFDKVPSLQARATQRHLLLWPISLGTISLNSRIVQNPGYGN
ncbi:RagB/SusD family protein [Belliella baltica DSM 15883]|uniref:RagB/SusD family protein n=1 Tax=Belliella baltica (strain DSM 15883 / CIP 108006 / LMG 21964 / BA134) TaxID=866536 RepID=I3Z940_BELBD|nr:RagB/SusD family nutrient uptake outer membrane protein [Belliella baltica]AFL85758.1 RagB/SusD family protein [Belliella baltica DSM 15883]